MVFALLDWGNGERRRRNWYVDNAWRYGLDPAVRLNMTQQNRRDYIVNRVEEAARTNANARNFLPDIRRYMRVVDRELGTNLANI